MTREKYPKRLLLQPQQLHALELFAQKRSMPRPRGRLRLLVGEVEDRSLAAQAIVLRLLARGLRLAEHCEHATSCRTRRIERPAFDEALYRLPVDGAGIHARAEVPDRFEPA